MVLLATVTVSLTADPAYGTPTGTASLRVDGGAPLTRYDVQVLDPRTAFQTVSILEGVIQRGVARERATGTGGRARGTRHAQREARHRQRRDHPPLQLDQLPLVSCLRG